MDKTAIKKYAVWARRELIQRVSQKAREYGISEDNIVDENADKIDSRLLSDVEIKQRKALIVEINSKGYEQVLEEVAYTWFNRFCALRFMEVNNYIPSYVKVFTDEENNFNPMILKEAVHLDFKCLKKDVVYEYIENNEQDELYKYLIISQCNELSDALPGIFQEIADYSELLFPDNVLREGSVIHQMITDIPEDDWKDAVQIIGWLYQYYNSELKDEVFANLKKNVKISKEKIPAATQLFTPDWIVRYMVENSLGRLWVEGHPDDKLKSTWRYYLDEAEQEPDVKNQLDEIRKEYQKLKPEDIKVIDPCMGSGHILAYVFDVLMQIYGSYGYSKRDAVKSILKNNLYGLDIDDRAAQLAYFSVMMKARQYDHRAFDYKIQPHVYSIVESNGLGVDAIDYFTNNNPKLKKDFETLVNELHDAKEYGSILNVSQVDFSALYARVDEVRNENKIYRDVVVNDFLPLICVAEVMAQKYDVVVTNPPYMGNSGMSSKLSEFVKKNYPDSKSDLFAVFMERCGQMTSKNHYQAMITQHAWMFLSSFEKLRTKLLMSDTVNMAHLGARAFEEIGGEVVQTTTFVLRKSHLADHKGTYCRLVDPATQQGKEDLFLAGENRYTVCQDNFSKIPGSPVAYWTSGRVFSTFSDFLPVSQFSDGKVGLQTGNNDVFLRLWFEIEFKRISFGHDFSFKWFPYNKGGGFRRWFGNNEYVLNWENDGFQVKNSKGAYPRNTQYYFRAGITWSDVATGMISMRAMPDGFAFDTCAPCLFAQNSEKELLAFFNTKVAQVYVDLMSPTMHYTCGTLLNIPFGGSKADISTTVLDCTSICKTDWDSFETSWDFTRHPLVRSCSTISEAYAAWEQECNERFNTLKANEEELNRIFIDIYGLQDELSPEVEDKDVTVRKADLGRDIRSLISYAVGCMFGRYSLDTDGLAYAGGDWNNDKYSSFIPDKNNILPILDDEYFQDDIVAYFIKFIETVYGKDTLEVNLRYIAEALGGKGSPREAIRNYFLKDFYKDHCKIYQKRPIYWLFDSGKKDSFKALIYIHRYKPDLVARVRTEYVHEQQAKYRSAIESLEKYLLDADPSQRAKISKRLQKLKDQNEELLIFEEKIHHLADRMIKIDLDDGVKNNYELFKEVLANIK